MQDAFHLPEEACVTQHLTLRERQQSAAHPAGQRCGAVGKAALPDSSFLHGHQSILQLLHMPPSSADGLGPSARAPALGGDPERPSPGYCPHLESEPAV